MSSTASEHRSCVMCGSARHIRILEATDHRQGMGGRFAVVRCAQCGLARTDPWPRDLGAWYPATYQQHSSPTLTARVVAAAIRRTSRGGSDGLRRLVATLVPDADLGGPVDGATEVLDVGAGNGNAVGAMRAAGVQAAGVEPSSQAVEAARVRGIDTIVAGTLESATGEGQPMAGRSWDLIRIYHVLEHVPDPVGTLSIAREHLNPGGRVVVCVPNLASATRRLTGPAWDGLELPRHLHHFEPATLTRVVEAAGLRVTHLNTVAVFGVLPASLDAWTAGGTRQRGWGKSLPVRAAAYPLELAAAGLGRGDAILLVATAAQPADEGMA